MRFELVRALGLSRCWHRLPVVADIPEILVIARGFRAYPLHGVVHEHELEQFHAGGIQARSDSAPRSRLIPREIVFVIRHLEDGWPLLLGRGAKHLDDLGELLLLGGSREKWASRDHLSEDTTAAPNVDRR